MRSRKKPSKGLALHWSVTDGYVIHPVSGRRAMSKNCINSTNIGQIFLAFFC